MLSKFWTAVAKVTENLTAPFLFRLVPISTRAYKRSLLRHLLIAGISECIPLLWKQTSLPTEAMWLQRVSEIQKMEQLTATIYDRKGLFW